MVSVPLIPLQNLNQIKKIRNTQLLIKKEVLLYLKIAIFFLEFKNSHTKMGNFPEKYYYA